MSSRAHIIASIGPASSDASVQQRMIAAGMDVARINFSHGACADNVALAESVRRLAREAEKRVPIIQDLAGPRVQTGSAHTFDSAKDILTEKDLADLTAGCAARFEYVAQSFVGSAQDVHQLRSEIAARSGSAKIIAKIERVEAVEHFSDILSVADAIMIARGDLGDAVPVEDIPFLERRMITETRAVGKPVITATQMLYTMTDARTPTRAEVTDVAYAILLGSDAVMLSDETARGHYPVEAVTMMERIVSRAERETSVSVRVL